MAAAAALRIAAGSAADVMDPSGQAWSADHGASGGMPASSASPIAIAGTDTPALYNSERYGAAGFTYTLPVPDGQYDVHLGFAETYVQASGQRRFLIAIDGQTVATEFDIFDAAGGVNRAVVESYPVDVVGGQLQIAFLPGSIQNPKVNTIEVVPR
jgi:hypothetical protein